MLLLATDDLILSWHNLDDRVIFLHLPHSFQSLGCSPKPLKILVALSENQPGEVPDDERLRLYIKVPEGRDEDEVKQHFKCKSFFYLRKMIRWSTLSNSMNAFVLLLSTFKLIFKFTLISTIYLAAFGNVEYFNIPKDRVTGKSKGFGYVKVKTRNLSPWVWWNGEL